MLNWVIEPFTLYGAWQIIAVAALTNVACALLGCYLVLRRMSMMGDALSHAVLPGLVMAFLFSASLAILPMFAGALAIGMLTALCTQLLHRLGGVSADSAMGVVFTSLFALGVLLVHIYAHNIHIDAECVFEGLLDAVYLDTVLVNGYEVPKQLLTILPVVALNAAFVLLFWKELLVASFDGALADTMGFRSGLMHYFLMAMVALTSVASFQAVGSILVVAMLIAPPATAQLLCDRMRSMLLVAVASAVLTAVLGYWLYIRTNTNAAGMMAVVAGGQYLLAVLFAPRYGILGAVARNVRTSLRILREDLLAMLYRLEELAAGRTLGEREATAAVGGGLLARVSLWMLIRRGRVRNSTAGLQLTDDGRRRAQRLVRSHRLWESYLVHQLNLPSDHVHDPAERMEHYIDAGLRRQLAEELGAASQDPHGREIPEVEE
jgi:manganese/zinc/iron transport system permease protein